MVFNLRKVLISFLLAAVLLPAIAFANTEFKGTETVNINRADAATLAAYLKGVGANKAKAIVDYRKKNGKFGSVDDLENVPGIGKETIKDNKRKMSTSRGKTVAPEGYKLGKSSGKSKSSSKKSTKKKTTSSRSSSKSDDSSASSSKKSSSTSSSEKSSSTSSSNEKASKSSKSKKKSSKSAKGDKKKKSSKKDKKSKDKKKKKKSKKKDK